jgi:hypothetical protein
MIPNHFSLVAVNPFQQAVQLAIIDVESSLMAGKRLGRFPWAMALLRRLRVEQAGRITAKDVMCATSGYEPGSRDGYNKDKYIEALDRLIETRGDVCPMPLSGSTVDMYFPEVRFRERERHYRRFDVAASRRSRQREKNSTRNAGVIRLRWRRPKLIWRLSRPQDWLRGISGRNDRGFMTMT